MTWPGPTDAGQSGERRTHDGCRLGPDAPKALHQRSQIAHCHFELGHVQVALDRHTVLLPVQERVLDRLLAKGLSEDHRHIERVQGGRAHSGGQAG